MCRLRFGFILPSKTPVIFFCLDNSSFLAASEEGGLIPISNFVPEDDGYHVAGALVVAPGAGDAARNCAAAASHCEMWRFSGLRGHAMDKTEPKQAEVPVEEMPCAGDCPGWGAAGLRREQHDGEEGEDDEGRLGQRPDAYLRQDGVESH